MAGKSSTLLEGGVATGEPAIWRDSKRWLWPIGLIVPLFPPAAVWLALDLGWRIGWWLGPIWILVIVPALDLLMGTDTSNPPASAEPQLERDPYYRWCTYLFLPLQYGSLLFACWIASQHPQLPWVDWLGFALTVGAVGGIAINTSHELGHKKPQVERWLAKIALAQTAYGHFFVEHNRGHHTRVATPEDPASARLGESFWAFWPRTVVGSVRSAWQIERKRLARHRHGPWTWRNDVLHSWAMTLLLFGGLTAAFGWPILGFLALQALFGFSLLEVVNYLEHYGLLRQSDGEGHYVRCNPQHSWNSNHIASNLLLYNLERHSDHHAWPARRYQALRHFAEAPQLPTGYGGMLVLAVFPPLWRAVMDKRVIAHYGGRVELAHLHPPAREKLLARWGKPPA